MSVNVYFKDEVRQHESFESVPHVDGSGSKMTAAGISLFYQGSRLYNIGGSVPPELVEFVDYYSTYEWLSAERTRRETGVYRHEDAEAEVELADGGKKAQYRIKLKAKKMESADALLHLIKTGAIRPTESYEGTQQGMSRIELEQNLSDARQDLDAMREIILEFESKKKKTQQALRDLFHDLHDHRWPFILKRKVFDRVNEILTDV